jgi:hypothetical protein
MERSAFAKAKIDPGQRDQAIELLTYRNSTVECEVVQSNQTTRWQVEIAPKRLCDQFGQRLKTDERWLVGGIARG